MSKAKLSAQSHRGLECEKLLGAGCGPGSPGGWRARLGLTPVPHSKSLFLHFLQYAVKESIIQILQCLGQQNLVTRSQLHGKSIVRKWTETSRTINSPCDQLALRPAGEGHCVGHVGSGAGLPRLTCVGSWESHWLSVQCTER